MISDTSNTLGIGAETSSLVEMGVALLWYTIGGELAGSFFLRCSHVDITGYQEGVFGE